MTPSPRLYRSVLCCHVCVFRLVRVTARIASTVAILAMTSAPLHAREAINQFHLPADVSPIAYEISVDPDLEHGSFSGSEKITISVAKPTSQIVLNAIDLKLSKVSCSQTSSKPYHSKIAISYRKQAEQVVLDISSELKPGRYTLSFDFAGALPEKLQGLYRFPYTDPTGAKHWLAVTQMEPIDARRMFPCFDEPADKATFTLSVKIDPAYVALSNSPVISETEDKASHRKIVHFAQTPKMSSYLVALAIGPFVQGKTVSSDGVPITVWTLPGKEKLGTYASGVAVKLMKYYDEYFGVPYPAKKLDLVAVPNFLELWRTSGA